MKKLLALLFSLFLLSSPSVFADDIDLYELSTKYPQCQNSTYRDECFDDYSFGADGKEKWVGYFRDNVIWEGLIWQNDVLTFEVYEGVDKSTIRCPEGLNGWYNCPDGQKFRSLEDGYIDVNKKLQGRFIVHYAGGNVFEGNYKNNLRNSYGKFTWLNGDVYEGNFKNDYQNGYGKMTWSNVGVYEGNWENMVQNGYGKMTWSDGNVYEGNWENGTQNGYGKFTWSDGDIYEGNWENGNMSD